MIRVAFILSRNNRIWNGGLNYYRNLLRAICDLPDPLIEPVIVTDTLVDKSAFPGYPDVEIVRSSIFDRHSIRWYAQRSVDHLFARDVLIEPLLTRCRIDLLSHVSYLLNPSSSIPTCVWIPDLQIVRYPQFFSVEEIAVRTRDLKRACRRASRIILSSFDAQHDLDVFAPEMVSKSSIMQFVSRPSPETEQTDLETLRRKYSFAGSFFLLPSQLWMHKNHKTVILAVETLAAKKREVLVLAPGKQYDSRHEEYPAKLVAFARDHGVSESFRLLGEIPYSDLSGLMTHCVSMVTASLFEGWSTTVEEAKSIGKEIILSDIPVHREQNPLGGIFFNPTDANGLADILWERHINYDSASDLARRLEANRQLPARWQAFGQVYSDIVTSAIGNR